MDDDDQFRHRCGIPVRRQRSRVDAADRARLARRHPLVVGGIVLGGIIPVRRRGHEQLREQPVSRLLLRARLFVVLARPPLLLLLAMSGALGAASAGAALELGPALVAFAVVVPCLVYAVSPNDLVDVRVDRINLPDDPSRPARTRAAATRDAVVVAGVAAVLALALAA